MRLALVIILLATSRLASACDQAWREFITAPSEESLGYAITSSVGHECALSNATVDALTDGANAGGLLESRGALAATSFVEGGDLMYLLRAASRSVEKEPQIVITAYLEGVITEEVFLRVLVVVPDEYLDDMTVRIRELAKRRAAIAQMMVGNERALAARSLALRTIDENMASLGRKVREKNKE